MKRRIFAGLLVFGLVCSLLPGTALAADAATTPTTSTVEYEITGGKIILDTTTKAIIGCTGNPSQIVIPSYIEGNEVTGIAKTAFNGKSGIKDIVIPETVTSIEKSAFAQCTGLESVTILGNKKITIEEGTFANCSLKRFVGAVGTIESNAFSGCPNLESVIIPGDRTAQGTAIKSAAFTSCPKLANVYIAGVYNDTSFDGVGFIGCAVTIIHVNGKFSKAAKEGLFGKATTVVAHTSATNAYIDQKSPTCVDKGYIQPVCSCNGEDCKFNTLNIPKVDLPVIGHKWVTDSTDPNPVPDPKNTCETITVTYEEHCANTSICSETRTRTEIIEGKAEHKYEYDAPDAPQQEAKCNQYGVKFDIQTCEVCGFVRIGETDEARLIENFLKYKELTEPDTSGASQTPPTAQETAAKEKAIADALAVLAELGYVTDDKTAPAHIERIDKLAHTADLTKPFERVKSFDTGDCKDGGKGTVIFKCTECGEEFEVSNYDIEPGTHVPVAEDKLTDEQKKAIQDKIADDPNEYKDAEPTCQATGSKVRYCSVCKTVYVETLPKLDHNWVDIEATCETEGLKNGICGNEGCNEKNPDATEVIPKVPHEAAEDAEVKTTDTKPAKCTEAGERVVETSKCKFCQKAFSTTSVVPATGHTPGDDVKKDETQYVAPTCDKPGKQVLTGTCEVCGERIAASEFEIPPLGHKFGEWTKTSDGGQERTCSVCGLVQKENSNGEILDPDGEPEEPTPPDDTPDPDAVYTISLSSDISNGSVRRSDSSAKAGETITLTSYANAGYELNSIYVLDRSGNYIALTTSGGNTHTFTMPAARVTVYASFTSAYSNPTTGSGSAASSSNGNNSSSSSSGSGIPVNRTVPRATASGSVFYDIPSNHWASGEIAWAYQNGFMSGTGTGGFNPDGTFTYQQMWMVLARLTGNHPANMAEAKQWAARNGFAEGANPAVPVTRQQLVTALYRCAALLGRSTASHGSLAGYKDSKTVPNAARNAMSWAITNGIISGTSDGRLNPGGTTTRAQFAVILYRYYRQIM